MKLNHLGYWCLTLILSATVHGESILADPIPAARKVNWTYMTASLNGIIELKSDNVTLRGAGADNTILTGGSILAMGRGYNLDSGIAIIGGGLKDSNTITVASTAGLSVGTIIEIDRDNDLNLIVLAPNRAVTQVNAITKITGNILELKNPLFYDYTKGNPRIKFTFTPSGDNAHASGMVMMDLDRFSSPLSVFRDVTGFITEVNTPTCTEEIHDLGLSDSEAAGTVVPGSAISFNNLNKAIQRSSALNIVSGHRYISNIKRNAGPGSCIILQPRLTVRF